MGRASTTIAETAAKKSIGSPCAETGFDGRANLTRSDPVDDRAARCHKKPDLAAVYPSQSRRFSETWAEKADNEPREPNSSGGRCGRMGKRL